MTRSVALSPSAFRLPKVIVGPAVIVDLLPIEHARPVQHKAPDPYISRGIGARSGERRMVFPLLRGGWDSNTAILSAVPLGLAVARAYLDYPATPANAREGLNGA